MQVKERIAAAGLSAGADYTRIPTFLKIDPGKSSLISGADFLTLESHLFRHGGYPAGEMPRRWTAGPELEQPVSVHPSADTRSARVEGRYEGESVLPLTVEARTASGLQAAAQIELIPPFLDPPGFLREPSLSVEAGTLRLDYELALEGRPDDSVTRWFRLSEEPDQPPVLIAYSNQGVPVKEYALNRGDQGRQIYVEVEPKHNRSAAGPKETAVSVTIAPEQVVHRNHFSTDFTDFPACWQPRILPGAWTLDSYKPSDTEYYDWKAVRDTDTWAYTDGVDGSAGLRGMAHIHKGARMLYTPVEENEGGYDR
ncbi:MAG: hypothetical protein LUD68_01790 [Rikenellaceae bacterium]|nr:hypothetical protein [Rikenellaceae bacterium]